MRYIIEKEYLKDNINAVKDAVAPARIIGVVKGGGYGLGNEELARFLLGSGVDFLAAARLDEAGALRRAGIDAPILLMTPVTVPNAADSAVALGLTVTVDSVATARAVDDAAKRAGVRARAHIKLDTGLGRYGFLPDEGTDVITAVTTAESIDFEGIFSHFSSSFAPSRSTVDAQLRRFNDVCTLLEGAGIDCGMKHIANSSAALRYPDTRLDAVRIGSAFLGRLSVPNTYSLKKVGYLECEVNVVKNLPKNYNIGYGDVYRTKKPIRAAIIPVGHTDGFGMEKRRDSYRVRDSLRELWHVFRDAVAEPTVYCRVNGKRAPVIGRVGLTNIVADVTDIPCEAGDIASFEMNPLAVDSSVERAYL